MAADTGPIGGDLSHEFIILAETGESQVYCHKDLIELAAPGVDVDFDKDLSPIIARWTGQYAATDEKHDAARFEAEVPQDKRMSARGIEVGHIFFFGTKYSEPMGCKVQGPGGEMITLQMGSYGVGVSRLVAAIIEACHDDAGIKWPVPVAPFEVGVVNLKAGDTATDSACEGLVSALERAGLDVLYDDTDERAGAKFTTMDLIGLPLQAIVGPKGAKAGEVEIKDRRNSAKETVSVGAAAEKIASAILAARRLGL
jgi:prolyl-tRNA synthetase